MPLLTFLATSSLAALAGRPMPMTIAPYVERILLGTQVSGGNLGSWAADDNDARKVCKLFTTDARIFVRVTLEFATGTTQVPSSLELRLKAGSMTPGLQTLWLYFVSPAGIYERSTVWKVTFVEGSTYVALPTKPIAGYIRANGVVAIGIEVGLGGPSTSLFPCTSFEFANLVLTY